MSLDERIKRHEGFRGKPYDDTKGIVTIGYGRNLEANPLTEREADFLYRSDLQRATVNARRFAFYDSLSPNRQDVLIEMCFQMGYGGVMKFKKFRVAAMEQRWQDAHDEMLDSAWHRTDSPPRARELARIFLEG